MNLNLRGTTANSYDAIVVGSGITGGWAAKELCENGLRVLMLERGKPLEHPNYPTATKDPWDFPHRGRLTPEDYQTKHIQARHWSFRADNKHFYINDLDNPYEETRRFDWVRGDIVGGRSVLWSRQCLRFSDLDFEANARDGFGIDWPIRYKDIAPWYDYVETFVGVSGQAEGLAHLPDGKFQPPMPMNCVEKMFKEKVEASFPSRRVTMGRTANLTIPVKGRGICQYRNLCHRGCPYGAYFSTNAGTLPAAFATGKLTLQTNALVNRVLYDEKTGRATGVEVVDTDTNQVTEYFAQIIFLNAATLATAFILLNSTSSRFPNGLGNSSEQVGKNLMDHHKCMGLSADVEGFEDVYHSGRRPIGIQIPRFRNLERKEKDFLRGYNFQGEAARGGWNRGLDVGFGEALKEEMSRPGGWHIGFTGFGESLPSEDNQVTLNKSKTDKWGRPILQVDCKFGENEKAMQKDMAETIAEMMEVAGFKNIRVDARMSFPGNANHEMGTARMGNNPKNSVLNSFNQMHDVPNVFITDGSFMTSGSSVNPSLTYMAMTARACHYAVSQFRKRNL
ncbi:MAG TPA: GMC family oxidoreductase [Chryseosolibacter sp.]|nr:GMC family oxidoreductase [Chryseosolibacter sp.]